MKKYIYILLSAVMAASCSNLDGLNTDTKSPTDVPTGSLVANATKNLFDQMTTPNVNSNAFRFFAQYWTETTYTDEANYNIKNRDVPGNHWGSLYRDVLEDLDAAYKKVESSTDATLSDAQKNNQLATLEILKVYTYHILVDTFGYIPYTESLDFTQSSPAYDSGSDVYADLITRLDAAISNISVSAGTFNDGYDIIYNGDASKWLKFANSLKLRLALRYANTDGAKAKQIAEEAINAGVFTSSEDNAQLVYLSSPPNTNPIWENIDPTYSGRKDFVGTNTIIDIMNNLNDPRRQVYFRQNMGDDTYVGGPYAKNGNTWSNSSVIGDVFFEPTFPANLLTYTETEFNLAEAAARGYNVSGSVASHYNAGITASINYWYNLAGMDASGVATAYLANTDVAYATASGTWQEKIATQKWLALYDQAFEGWSTYRKFGFPAMHISGETELPTPRRYTYPQEEPTLNGANYEAASSALGGDELSSRIFWDTTDENIIK
ncbi:SusD/RagB family nutrient-binding outer membrane lipoprotein [Zhouia sp. PK063]|uniref:SusD/RagB family nutrient-binding outer membrane lipoprotein n=1 Tax=Zhouia sp. PK063 TaxID=3373602 RepID=UPI00378CB376